jgi:N-acetylglucosaminyldiphosphoundecaprenol N-acetyl-beta-D-mannosaminyltransferase
MNIERSGAIGPTREGNQRLNVLGIGVSTTNLPAALSTLEDWIINGRKTYVCVTGVHGVMEAQKDAKLKEIHNQSGLTVPDGMPLVWAGKIYGHKNMGRVYGPDFMLEVCKVSVQRQYTHFLYGGKEGVAEKLKENLVKKFPGLSIVGTYTPPFRPLNEQEEEGLIQKVAGCCPDLFWVGLSTPKQERFMYHYLPKLDTGVMIGVGAAFDIHAGLFKDPPEWIKQSGLQWGYRLGQDPRRLWKRYLTNNPVFVGKFLRQLFADILKGGLRHE